MGEIGKMIERIPGKKGFTIRELVLVFAAVFIMGYLLMPFVKSINRNMERTICSNNLREIGLALYIYAREHDGKFPPGIKTLYDEQYLNDEKMLNCPGSKEQGFLEDPDYIYIAGLSVRDPSTKILLRDKAKNHSSGGQNVLYVNGSVEWEE
ncbi:MAG: type II secretion system protein [Candidatus Omnitrophota bacterium]